MRAKRVIKFVVKKDLNHESYKRCLFDQKEMKYTEIRINSVGHQIGVYEQVKTSLNPLDTKKMDCTEWY